MPAFVACAHCVLIVMLRSCRSNGEIVALEFRYTKGFDVYEVESLYHELLEPTCGYGEPFVRPAADLIRECSSIDTLGGKLSGHTEIFVASDYIVDACACAVQEGNPGILRDALEMQAREGKHIPPWMEPEKFFPMAISGILDIDPTISGVVDMTALVEKTDARVSQLQNAANLRKFGSELRRATDLTPVDALVAAAKWTYDGIQSLDRRLNSNELAYVKPVGSAEEFRATHRLRSVSRHTDGDSYRPSPSPLAVRSSRPSAGTAVPLPQCLVAGSTPRSSLGAAMVPRCSAGAPRMPPLRAVGGMGKAARAGVAILQLAAQAAASAR